MSRRNKKLIHIGLALILGPSLMCAVIIGVGTEVMEASLTEDINRAMHGQFPEPPSHLAMWFTLLVTWCFWMFFAISELIGAFLLVYALTKHLNSTETEEARPNLAYTYVKGVPPAERPPAPKLHATPPLRAEDVARFEAPSPKPAPKLVERATTDPVTQHYLLVNKERHGPYSAGQLRKQLADKEITRDTLCKEVDGSEWLPVLEMLRDPKPLCETCKVEEVEKAGEVCPKCRKIYAVIV